jgi:two-component system NtrC family response regulator
MAKILIVDDEKDLADIMGANLLLRDYKVEKTVSGEEALEKIKKDRFDLAIIDIRLPGMDGIELFQRAKEIDPFIRVIMITGFSAEDKIEKILKEGAYACLKKPIDIKELLNLIEVILKNTLR